MQNWLVLFLDQDLQEQQIHEIIKINKPINISNISICFKWIQFDILIEVVNYDNYSAHNIKGQQAYKNGLAME